MSDSMNGPRGLVIGTAGHIDHGKTSLVRALTGIDTDRLAEEKRRGISIDLGFAHMALPGGAIVSFIDVPGHERFIRNMLAGAAGIQAVMLVVAADESVMPQTREHFEICRLLGVRSGFVVLTKIDLASPEQIKISCQDVEALCAESFLEGAPVVQVSSTQGRGMRDVVRQLETLAERALPPGNEGIARLPIDRSFSLKGFGTVVTGTLTGGRLRTGEKILLHPARKEVRIRGLQVHGKQVSEVGAGQRTAVNLAGIESSEILRGHVIASSAELESTETLDVAIDWLGEEEPTNRMAAIFHSGTAEIPATLKILAAAGEPARSFGRLWLSAPALVLPGDRFILRRPSPAQTIAGGQILETFPQARVRRSKMLARLTDLAKCDDAGRVEFFIAESATGRRLGELVRVTGRSRPELLRMIETNSRLVFHAASERVLTMSRLAEQRTKLLEWLRAFHAGNPSVAGAPMTSARLGLEPELANIVFDRFPAVRVQGDVISLATHKAELTGEEASLVEKLESAFRAGGFQPPALGEALKLIPDARKARGLLEALLKSRKLVRVSEDLVFHADAISQIRAALAAQKGRVFSVPEFKDWIKISRKYAIPLLEYLDRAHLTRREGDKRIAL